MTNKKPHIILGNGFNLALKEIVNFKIKLGYNEILQEIKLKISKSDERLTNFLQQTSLNQDEKINDLEKLLWILQYSITCLKYDNGIYANPINNFENLLHEDIEKLKRITIDVLTNGSIHPKWVDIFNETNQEYINNCSQNLESFERIFSINYDLILYWLLNHTNLLEKRDEEGNVISGIFKDGFSNKNVFKPIDNTGLIDHLYGFAGTNNFENVIFLHGALHLLRQGRNAYKIIKGNSDKSLSALRHVLIEHLNDFDNLLVFDATSIGKLNEIYGNDYLIKAYDKLVTISTPTVIYGCKIIGDEGKDNDYHLWRRIINSKAKYIYVGREGGDLDSEAEKIANYFQKLKCTPDKTWISCFSYTENNIWSNENFYQEILNNRSKSFPVYIKQEQD